MSVLSARAVAVSILLAVCGMTSCSHPTPGTSDRANFYWSAAGETYAAADYGKTADHLEHLLDAPNQYTALAIPWYLMLTSGMAAGYMELADQYVAGAHMNKTKSAAFRSKAAAYRMMASEWAMRFAQNADRLKQIPLGPLPLGFALPNGSAAEPALLSRIAQGVPLPPADADAAEVLTLRHAVLMAVCQAAGAPQNLAKAEDILGRKPAEVPRATFGNAVADMLDSEAALYGRNRLDQPQKLTALRERAAIVRKEAARVGSARIVEAASVARPK